MSSNELLSRRTFFGQAFAASLGASVPFGATHGIVRPPVPLPAIHTVRQDGTASTLRSASLNHITALQLIFTRCTNTCLMQGDIFERVQSKMPDMAANGIQLISLSVDPTTDSPQALAAWLRTFHAGPSWLGMAPAYKDLAGVKAFFGAGRNPLDPHFTQSHIIDRNGQMIWRTTELPEPDEIVSIVRKALKPV